MTAMERLNGPWHERANQYFMAIVLAHWAEHLTQAWQVYVLHWPRPEAGGGWACGSRGWSSPSSCITSTPS